MAESARVTLENACLSLAFDRGSGKLRSLANRETGGEYLQATPTGGNLFAVYHDFTRLFDITADNAGTPCVASNPADVTRSVFSPGEAESLTFERSRSSAGERLAISYRGKRWRARLTLSLPRQGVVLRATLRLTNADTVPQSCLCVFPFLSGVRLGRGTKNLMVVNDQAGHLRPLWCEQDGGIYGNSYRMSMQWGCVFDEPSRNALGFLIPDATLRPKDIRYQRPSIEVRYIPPQTIDPGRTVSFPDAEIMVTTGDWKPTAERYHRWLLRAFPPVRHAPWVRELDSHLGQWFGKRARPGALERPNAIENRLWSFADLPAVYRTLPVGNIEFAFHGEGSSRKRVIDGARSFIHTDGDNVLRRDLGGARALKKGIAGVHALGLHFTFYVEGYIVPFDADIVTKRGARAWAVMNRDGTNLGNYSRWGWLQMCPGCVEWQDHLTEVAARLVRETGADGVRLDSLGTYFFPCYNPAHRHRSPFDFNLWMVELLDKVSRAVRKVSPGCLLTTEAPVDFYAHYFDGALTQQVIGTQQISVSRDVAPMRVALPEYAVFPHNPCGPVAASLMGYPGGDGGIEPGGRFSLLAEKWRSVRFAAAEALRWGNAAHANPRASRPDVECRRFSGPDMDAIVVARVEKGRDPASYRGRQHTWMYLNGDVDLLPGRAFYTVSLETEGRRPTAAYVYDVEGLSVRPLPIRLREESVTLRLGGNWLLCVLCYGPPPTAVSMVAPEAVAAGGSLRVCIDAAGPLGVAARLDIPGWGIRARPVRVPGEVEIRAPRGASSGSYVATLSGPGVLGWKAFLRVS